MTIFGTYIGWLKRLFGVEPLSSRATDTLHSGSTLAPGCWYEAHVSLNTPLEALRRHGEYYAGLLSVAPPVVAGNHGKWAVRTKTFRESRIDVAEFSGTIASPIGYITKDEAIPFLIAFREVVEGGFDHKTQIAKLLELKRHPVHGPYWKRFRQADQDFPYSFFYRSLIQLPGIGPKTARSLYEAGFYSPADIRAASLEKLGSVPALGKAQAAKLKRACEA